MPGDLGLKLISNVIMILIALTFGFLVKLIKLVIQFAIKMIKEIKNVIELYKSHYLKVLNTILHFGVN